ncbi:MAG: MATE family efflux transporter [Clostridium argentinense]|uniref:Probable multidrug resistance protein NorM n=1 Tax=Clostridium faecium TaxID=2762223 RepID=A0ABR8YMM8_9CLOT|nr:MULTISPECIES: MATE family efflux transporter [Clostridium]MBD8045490.1 MATE family efflux transporter [Clostridium faecium]MBS5825432.1 MATE family efflux transporter [Clostridium argentinense]MDU1348919.1 MATE family efflux transporter [Clostridium argentinense]
MENSLDSKEKFYKRMLSLALPIMIQNLISSSLNMVDTMMIGKLGEVEIASVGLANQFYFLFSLFIFGLNSGCAIFIAQFWGKKDVKSIRKVLGLCIILGSLGAVFFTVAALIFPTKVMEFFTKDNQVILLGVEYLQIVGWSYVITAISFAFSFASRSIGRAKLPMVTSAVALICNTVFNAILIFGKLGFPVLGVKGAAIATVIARIIEMILILSVTYIRKTALAGKLNEFCDLSKEFIFSILKTIYPVVINEIFWSLGITMYSVAYAKISTNAVATFQIAGTVQNIFTVAAFGLANACAVMIGNEIGANREENAMVFAKRFVKVSFSLGILIGILLFVSSSSIVSLYNVSPEVIRSAKIILRVYSFVMPFRMLSSLFIVGILRSGGDTKYSLMLEMSGVWGVGVPIAFLGALVFKFPIELIVSLVYLEELVKISFCFPRLFSRKWIKNLVRDI